MHLKHVSPGGERKVHFEQENLGQEEEEDEEQDRILVLRISHEDLFHLLTLRNRIIFPDLVWKHMIDVNMFSFSS